MLSIQKIFKKYKTGDFVQTALDGVSLNFRDNEFVAILGPSGSGKTTLLNIIGGLDQYDEGDLVIDGISTKEYKSKDWDRYRNHSIGFVFQTYNLIPHLSILANVELALTISGVSKKERRQRAIEALEKVGLKDHIKKRPNQLSGGQMQRVAIARALVNNPDILLADEPTGALDSETSVQIMDLLKDVAKDRLVIMVTHNPDLAEEYATRIVELKDGVVVNDTNPVLVVEKRNRLKKFGKISMSFLTALNLSFRNLSTKKARTLLTAFAGSIGIIGIAMILSISSGVNQYIDDIQRETMTSYPITIQAESIDLSSIMENDAQSGTLTEKVNHDFNKIYSDPERLEEASSLTNSISENNLTDFKKYLDDPNSEIHKYIGENGIVYSYDTKFELYGYDENNVLVNTNGTNFGDDDRTIQQQGVNNFMAMGDNRSGSVNISQMRGEENDNNASEIIPGQNGDPISTAIIDQFDLLAGEWPESEDQVVLVLDHNNEIPAQKLYQLSFLPDEEYEQVMDNIDKGEEVKLGTRSWDYEDALGKTYQLLITADCYRQNANGTFSYIGDNEEDVKNLLNNSMTVSVVGVVKAKDEDADMLITTPIAYTQALTNYVIDKSNDSPVVKAQEDNPDVNVLNNLKFSPEDDQEKIEDAKTYLTNLGVSERATMMTGIMNAMGQGAAASTMTEEQLSGYLDGFLANPDDQVLLDIYNDYISSGSYDDNLQEFGKISLDAPSEISLYSNSFEDKDGIAQAIENYNKTVPEESKITYTDFVRLLMSSVTTIINVITWVLVAFVAVSLVVSSIMIGIITYISVLERTKEIGILRSIGASKWNITEVFTAETFIIGLLSGLIGIGVTLLLLIPTNSIIHNLTDNYQVNATLPVWASIVLVILSVILTLIGGFIPSRKAAQQNPVNALRTE